MSSHTAPPAFPWKEVSALQRLWREAHEARFEKGHQIRLRAYKMALDCMAPPGVMDPLK